MTYQQILNKIWKRFIVNRCKFGFDKFSGECIYSNETGELRCAIVCLVSKKTALKFQSRRSQLYWLMDELPKWMRNESKFRFLERIQQAHDNACSLTGDSSNERKSLKTELQLIAKDYNLKIPQNKRH